MVKVWIVFYRESPDEQPTVVGVFSTPELAASAITEDLADYVRHESGYRTEDAWLDGPTG